MAAISKQETAALVTLGRVLWELSEAHAQSCAKLIVCVEDRSFLDDMGELLYDVHDRGARYIEAFVRVIEYLELHAPRAVEIFREELEKIEYGR